jgi:hypothetical protein
VENGLIELKTIHDGVDSCPKMSRSRSRSRRRGGTKTETFFFESRLRSRSRSSAPTCEQLYNRYCSNKHTLGVKPEFKVDAE